MPELYSDGGSYCMKPQSLIDCYRISEVELTSC